MSLSVRVESGVARLVLDAPPLNILTRALLGRIRGELARLAGMADLRVLMLAAAGKHFSAGADVGEHLPPLHAALIPEFLDTIAAVDAFPLPVIAAVRGKCLGGGFELIQPADAVVAGAGASFGQPEIALGVIAPAACVYLPRRLPPGPAARLLYAGDTLSAADAERCGLVLSVVPDEEVDRAAGDLAARMARHSAAALRVAKRAARGAGQDERHAALRRAGAVYLNDLMATADAGEGLRAFVEKRPPVWRHA